MSKDITRFEPGTMVPMYKVTWSEGTNRHDEVRLTKRCSPYALPKLIENIQKTGVLYSVEKVNL